METPTIVRKTRDYLLIKVPLPKQKADQIGAAKNGKMATAEKRLWELIQAGEKEYREGKTIRARSTDEALKFYERKKDRIH